MQIIDLGAKRREQKMQQMMMMQQLIGRSALGAEGSALDRVLKEQEVQDRLDREEALREKVAKESISRQREATDAQIKRGLEASKRGEARYKLEEWQTGEQVQRGKESSARGERETRQQEMTGETTRTLQGAQTQRQRAETLGQLDENTRKQNEDLIDMANRRRNLALSKAANGEPLTPGQTDIYERDERMLSGDKSFTLQRDANGVWTPDKGTVARLTLDEKGMPKADYAKGLRDIDKPHGSFGQLIADAHEAEAKGANPETMKHFTDKIWSETAPTIPKIQGMLVKNLLDDGNVEGAEALMGQLKSGPPKTKMPPAAQVASFGTQTRMVSELESLDSKYQDLKASGKISVGNLSQPINKIRAGIGRDDPDVQTFLKSLDRFKAKYVLYLSGRAASYAEHQEITAQVPSRFDTFSTFEKALPDFRDQLVTDMSIDAGVLHSIGYQTPEGIPLVDPWDVVKRVGHLPNIVLDHGYIPSEVGTNTVKGIGALGRAAHANGVQIGGVGEARQKGNVDMSTGSPMSTETPQAGPSDNPRDYANPPAARGLLKRKAELEQYLGGQQ